jgi:hypothetical protein
MTSSKKPIVDPAQIMPPVVPHFRAMNGAEMHKIINAINTSISTTGVSLRFVFTKSSPFQINFLTIFFKCSSRFHQGRRILGETPLTIY